MFLWMVNLMTVKDAASELGISTGRVRVMITSGRLSAEKVGTQWLIKPKDLEKVRNRKPGRPSKA